MTPDHIRICQVCHNRVGESNGLLWPHASDIQEHRCAASGKPWEDQGQDEARHWKDGRSTSHQPPVTGDDQKDRLREQAYTPDKLPSPKQIKRMAERLRGQRHPVCSERTEFEVPQVSTGVPQAGTAAEEDAKPDDN